MRKDNKEVCTYLYLVNKTWRKTAIRTLLKSAPAHEVMPAPNGMKFFAVTFAEMSFYS